MTKKQVLEEYYKLKAKANRRLTNLEKLEKRKGYEHVTEWSYREAQWTIKKTFPGKNRFGKFTGKEPYWTIKGALNALKKFLDAPTSTKKGIDKIYRKRAKAINKKYGTKLKWQDLADFFTSEEWEKAAREYGSKTALLAIGEVKTNEDEIVKALKKKDDKKIERISTKSGNIKVEEAINDIISKYGIGIKEMF